MKVLIAALLLSACSCAATQDITEPEGRSCALVLSPVSELLDVTVAAAARWSKATGCAVTVGTDGIPVITVGRIPTQDGNSSLLGRTDRDGAACSEIEVDADATEMWEHTVAHETGHCLGSGMHSVSGLMSADSPRGSKIDESSLELVCSVAACTEFNSEDHAP